MKVNDTTTNPKSHMDLVRGDKMYATIWNKSPKKKTDTSNKVTINQILAIQIVAIKQKVYV